MSLIVWGRNFIQKWRFVVLSRGGVLVINACIILKLTRWLIMCCLAVPAGGRADRLPLLPQNPWQRRIFETVIRPKWATSTTGMFGLISHTNSGHAMQKVRAVQNPTFPASLQSYICKNLQIHLFLQYLVVHKKLSWEIKNCCLYIAIMTFDALKKHHVYILSSLWSSRFLP